MSCARCARAPSASPRTATTRWRSWSGCSTCWTNWSEKRLHDATTGTSYVSALLQRSVVASYNAFKEPKHRPEQIGEGRGGEQRAQRASRSDAFRSQGYRVVPDEREGALAARPQQRVVLLALAQQQVATGEPIGRLDLPGRVLHALLVDVDPPLLDRPARFALRFRQPGVDDRVHEREAIARRHAGGGDLLRQQVQRARLDVSWIQVTEENGIHRRGIGGGLLPVDHAGYFNSQFALGLTATRVLPVRFHLRLDVRPRQQRERSEERRVGKECRSRWSPYH